MPDPVYFAAAHTVNTASRCPGRRRPGCACCAMRDRRVLGSASRLVTDGVHAGHPQTSELRPRLSLHTIPKGGEQRALRPNSGTPASHTGLAISSDLKRVETDVLLLRHACPVGTMPNDHNLVTQCRGRLPVWRRVGRFLSAKVRLSRRGSRGCSREHALTCSIGLHRMAHGRQSAAPFVRAGERSWSMAGPLRGDHPGACRRVSRGSEPEPA